MCLSVTVHGVSRQNVARITYEIVNVIIILLLVKKKPSGKHFDKSNIFNQRFG